MCGTRGSLQCGRLEVCFSYMSPTLSQTPVRITGRHFLPHCCGQEVLPSLPTQVFTLCNSTALTEWDDSTQEEAGSMGQDLFFFFFFLILFYFLTLQYCIGFAIYQNESATGIHVFPTLNPPPSSLPIPSLWVVPVHQPQASSIVHRTWTGNSLENPMDRGAR